MDSTLAANCIEFIDKDNARGLCFCLLKKVSHACGAHTNEHFHKITAAKREERNVGFPSDCLGQKRFTGPWRANQKHTFRNARTDGFVTFWMFEKIDYFLELILRFVATGYVVESNAGFLLRDKARFALSETEDGLTRRADSAANETPEQYHQSKWQHPGHDELRKKARALASELHAELLQFLDQFRILNARDAK